MEGRNSARRNAEKPDKKKLMLLLQVLMITVALLMVLFAVIRLVRNSGAGEAGRVAVRNDAAFAVSADNVLDMRPLGSGVVVLTQTELVFLDSSGTAVRTSGHTFSTPAMDTNGSHVLLFDRGGTAFRIEKRAGLMFEGQTEKSIITARVTEQGNYALATRADDATSQLTVFSASNQEKFQWNCASEHIVAVDLADNNKRAVVAVLGSKDARLYAKAEMFDFSYDQSTAEFELGEGQVFSVDYTSRNNALVCASDGLHHIDGEKIEKTKAFVNLTPKFFSVTDSGRSALLLSRYNSDYSNELCAYDRKGKESFVLPVTERVKGLSCAASSVSLLLQDRVDTYNYKGERIGSVTLEGEVSRLVNCAGKLFVLQATGVRVFPADAIMKQADTMTTTAVAAVAGTTAASTTEEGTTEALTEEPGTTQAVTVQ